MATANFAPGTYYFGDIIYALDGTTFAAFWGDDGRDEGAYSVGGCPMFVAHAPFGNGEFHDNLGAKYVISARNIALVPIEGCARRRSQLERKGVVFDAAGPVQVYVSDSEVSVKYDDLIRTVDMTDGAEDLDDFDEN